MRLYFNDTHDLMCDMEDGKEPFTLGWVTNTITLGWVQNTNHTQFYCLCAWMTDMERESYQRPWLWPTAYPEEHAFDTEQEAMQALIDASMVAIIGGFRGRGTT